jgi:hypothetical protein
MRINAVIDQLRTCMPCVARSHSCGLKDMFATGSTAVTCFVRNEATGRMLYTANAGTLLHTPCVIDDAASCHTDPVPGDARAVLGRASGALRLSYDHKGTPLATTFSFTE